MNELLQYAFMRNALFAAILASVACGIIGTFVVVKRISFISAGIAHCAFGGIGLGYFLNINPLIAVIPYSILSALGMGIISKKIRIAEDTAIGIFWAFSMALGVIFISLTRGYSPDLFSYLFGNILTVPSHDLTLMIALNAVIILTVSIFFREFVMIAFDEEYALAQGVPSFSLYLVLLSLVALAVVILIRIVGIILVIALLTIPPAIARQYADTVKKMMVLSVIFSMLCTACGLWISYLLDLASGAVIIIIACLGLIASSLFTRIRAKSSS